MWIITMNITFAKMLLFFQERPAKSNDTWCTPQDVIPFPQTHICHPTHQDDEATKMDWMQCGTNISILFISVQFSRITTEEAAFLGFWNLIPPNQLKIILLYTTYQSIIIHPSIYLVYHFLKEKSSPTKKTWNLPNLVQPPSTHRSPSSPERLRPNCLLPLPLSVPRRRHVSNPTGQRANSALK